MKSKQELRPVDAPLFRYWEALYKSFYSSRLYVDVAKRWRGFGMLYLLLVFAVAALPLSLRTIMVFHEKIEQQLLYPFEQLPALYIQKGEVKFDKPMPYRIKNKKGEVVAMIDTTGKTKTISDEYSELSILVTKDSIHIRAPNPDLLFRSIPLRKPKKTSNVYQISKQTNEVLLGKDLVESSAVFNLTLFMQCMVYPAIVMIFFGLYLAFVFCMAFLGQVFASTLFHVKLKYKQSFRIFTVASTAPIFILFIMLTAKLIFPGSGLINIALCAIYYSYAVLSIKRESNKMVRM